MKDSCHWNYNYRCVCFFSICLLFSLLLWLGAGGAAHVVSSGLHYAGLNAGSLINGWSQRGQTQELRGSCTQQHTAHSTTVQLRRYDNNYMWVALTISMIFFSHVFYACTGTEVKPRALGWITRSIYCIYVYTYIHSFNIISSLITWQSFPHFKCPTAQSITVYTGSQCGFLSYKLEVNENELEETSEPDDVSLHSSSHTRNHKVMHTPQKNTPPTLCMISCRIWNAACGY